MVILSLCACSLAQYQYPQQRPSPATEGAQPAGGPVENRIFGLENLFGGGRGGLLGGGGLLRPLAGLLGGNRPEPQPYPVPVPAYGGGFGGGYPYGGGFGGGFPGAYPAPYGGGFGGGYGSPYGFNG